MSLDLIFFQNFLPVRYKLRSQNDWLLNSATGPQSPLLGSELDSGAPRRHPLGGRGRLSKLAVPLPLGSWDVC